MNDVLVNAVAGELELKKIPMTMSNVNHSELKLFDGNTRLVLTVLPAPVPAGNTRLVLTVSPAPGPAYKIRFTISKEPETRFDHQCDYNPDIHEFIVQAVINFEYVQNILTELHKNGSITVSLNHHATDNVTFTVYNTTRVVALFDLTLVLSDQFKTRIKVHDGVTILQEETINRKESTISLPEMQKINDIITSNAQIARWTAYNISKSYTEMRSIIDRLGSYHNMTIQHLRALERQLDQMLKGTENNPQAPSTIRNNPSDSSAADFDNPDH